MSSTGGWKLPRSAFSSDGRAYFQNVSIHSRLRRLGRTSLNDCLAALTITLRYVQAHRVRLIKSVTKTFGQEHQAVVDSERKFLALFLMTVIFSNSIKLGAWIGEGLSPHRLPTPSSPWYPLPIPVRLKPGTGLEIQGMERALPWTMELRGTYTRYCWYTFDTDGVASFCNMTIYTISAGYKGTRFCA